MQPLLQLKRIKYCIMYVSVSLSIQHAMRMRHIILSSVACPAIIYFSTLSHKRPTFCKKLLNVKSVSFLRKSVWNISYSKNNWVRYDKKCILVFMQSTCYSCTLLMKIQFSRQIFEKYSSIKFHKNTASGSPVVPCGQTDGQIWWS